MAGAAAGADRLPDAARLGDVGRHDRDRHRPRGTLGSHRDERDVGGPPNAPLPPVAHDPRGRQRARRGSRRRHARVPRARHASVGDRAGAEPGEPRDHQPTPARSHRRGAQGGAHHPRFRRDAGPPAAQRGRRASRRHAAAPPSAGRKAGGCRPVAGHLRHRHARGGRQHPDPHGADDGAHQVRRYEGACVLRARVPPARRPRRSSGVRPRRSCVGAGARTRRREREGAVTSRRRREGAPEGNQGEGTRRLRPLRRQDHAAVDDRPARSADVALQGDGRPGRQRARAVRRAGGAEAAAEHEPRHAAAASAAQAPRNRRVPQPGGRRRGRASTRRQRPLRGRACRVVGRGQRRARRVALLRSADAVRDRDGRHVRPRRSGLRARCRQRRRGRARRSAADPVRPAERGEGRGGGAAEGGGRAVRGTGRAHRIDHVADAVAGVDRRLLRVVPRPTSVGGRGAVAEVDRARDVGEWRHLRVVHPPLSPRPQRGSVAALSHRRVAHARSVAARRRLQRRARGHRRVAGRADSGDRCDAARRVGTPGRPAGPRPPGAGRAQGRDRSAGGVAHRRAHHRVRVGGAVGPPFVRRTGRPLRVGPAPSARRDGVLLGRVRLDGHRRRRPVGAVLPAGRRARPLAHRADSRRPCR